MKTIRAFAVFSGLCLALFGGTVARASPITYIFHFQSPDGPSPTGGFTYDSATKQFSDFQVTLGGTTLDYTAVANAADSILLFELGELGQNLIDGYGPLGPELSRWYGGASGFYGFHWRTPNPGDFLYVELSAGAPGDPIYAIPGAYAGTWSTSVADLPEPATLVPTALALTAVAVGCRRRRP